MNKKRKLIGIFFIVICIVGTFLLTLKWLSEFYCIKCDHSPKWIIISFLSTFIIWIMIKYYDKKNKNQSGF